MLVRNKIVDPFHDLDAVNGNIANSLDLDEMQHNCTVFKGRKSSETEIQINLFENGNQFSGTSRYKLYYRTFWLL